MSEARSHLAERADSGWESLFWLAFRRSTTPMSVLDEDARLLDVNEAMVELRGQTREEIVGAERFGTMPPGDRARAMREWQAVLRTGEGSGRQTLVRAGTPHLEYDWAARAAQIGGRRVVVGVMTRVEPAAETADAAQRSGALTPRERDVVTLIALGYDTREIAARLTVSPYTVRAHVRNAMSSLGASTRAQLAATALSSGLIGSLPDESARP